MCGGRPRQRCSAVPLRFTSTSRQDSHRSHSRRASLLLSTPTVVWHLSMFTPSFCSQARHAVWGTCVRARARAVHKYLFFYPYTFPPAKPSSIGPPGPKAMHMHVYMNLNSKNKRTDAAKLLWYFFGLFIFHHCGITRLTHAHAQIMEPPQMPVVFKLLFVFILPVRCAL